MSLQKTVRSSLVKQIVEQLAKRVEAGDWKVGERIPPEPELVEQLGVSRNTLREAVQALIHTGMLEARQGDGTYVRSSSVFGAAMQRRLQRSAVFEILEVRYGLEREIARLAAMRRSTSDLANIREKLEQAYHVFQDVDAYVRADVAFHIAIAEATKNSVMIDLYKHMAESLHLSVNSTVDLTGHIQTQFKTHAELVEAISIQDPDAAEAAVRNVIEASKAALASFIQEGDLPL
ncbi:FadR/GntR family transcriptional regulator [Brevibacillus centrosporus]|uniref:DNA-binding transcriptional regulator, FadR family n=1 Tax=Brevibacillus centrosporus TaxID=54910 RepID=A0A1I3SXY1_9BACL|nr:FadR/GntR family transcriptional regulator [Brevibacillus centrosporus]MEC2128150.1 FadR/GntR family transcriptional regulator [Brevibacillus centrosporus]RNB73983.1 FadR family transcriptional regulator [Brevibacillus centrosporus]GED30610.1 GntR family transcriptional regulator [Brevibacillus centrosporus]SFJ62276.1 DNA-binding transcriptional regulator, FadR family [Brevibacillus centrosporus]